MFTTNISESVAHLLKEARDDFIDTGVGLIKLLFVCVIAGMVICAFCMVPIFVLIGARLS